jgi:Rrf2 family protein
MKRDSRLSMTLHALLHIADRDGPVTSEAIAAMVSSNPVVVRRTLAGLRQGKLVRSTKGHGGGWELDRPLAAITLGDIYDALEAPEVFAMADRTESPGCLVEQAVNRAMRGAFAEAEAVLLARFREVSLADIAADVKRNDRRRKR